MCTHVARDVRGLSSHAEPSAHERGSGATPRREAPLAGGARLFAPPPRGLASVAAIASVSLVARGLFGTGMSSVNRGVAAHDFAGSPALGWLSPCSLAEQVLLECTGTRARGHGPARSRNQVTRVYGAILLSFGRKVRELRVARGMSQDELAHVAQMDRVFVGQLERGQRSASLDSVGKLAEALRVPPRDLLDFDRRPAREAIKPAERLGRRISILACGAPTGELERFERLAEAYFAAHRPRRKRS